MNRYYYSMDKKDVIFTKEDPMSGRTWNWSKITHLTDERIKRKLFNGVETGLHLCYPSAKSGVSIKQVHDVIVSLAPKYIMIIRTHNLDPDFRYNSLFGFEPDGPYFPIFDIDYKAGVIVPAGVIYDRKKS